MRAFIKSFLVAAMAVSAIAPPVRSQGIETFPNDPVGVKKAVLQNGFTVFMVEDASQPAVFGAVVVKAGGKNDPKDATGMAHYLEHMLFKGTDQLGTIDFEKERVFLKRIDSLYEVLGTTVDAEQRKALQSAINAEAVSAAAFAIPNEFDRMMASIGGTGLNAFTTEEMTVYHNTFPPNQVEKWCDIYAHRFQHPVFRLFQSELETVYEEKNRAMDNFAYALLRAFNRQLFKNHPYGQQEVIGETDHLKNPSLIKMYQYFNTYYVANNMALVLSGDFKAEEVLPIINAKFGKLQSKEVPVFPEYKEAEFKGREYIKGRYTPVKAGIAAFRTVPKGHPDEVTIEVLNQLLSNTGQTGLIDNLVLDQQLLMGQVIAMPHIDHGASLMIIVPKLLGQSTANAESKVLDAIRKIRLGDFDEALLQSAKTQLQVSFEERIEDNQEKALLVVEAFSQGESWEKLVAYPNAVKAVTKEMVMAAALKYYGDNYLILESKMGFPKKEKLEKPGYKPPLPPADAKSSYARYFETLSEGKPVSRFVDFKQDITMREIGPNASLLCVQNPHNDIFEMQLKYGMGTLADRRMPHAARFIDVSGTATTNEKAFKLAVAALGGQITFEAEDNFFTVRIKGLEENLDATLALFSDLASNLFVDASKIPILVREEKSDRKLSEKDVQTIGTAMSEKVKFGRYSSFLNRLSLKELEDLNADSLALLLKDAMSHACEVHYTGRKQTDEVARALTGSVFKAGFPSKPAVWVDKNIQSLDTRSVYFLDRKDALQSQLYFIKQAGKFNKEEAWLVDAFNEYFGGSMSALVFQEIREFRSLAYTANAPVRAPERAGGYLRMDGFIGCQADKTTEALKVMHSLIDSMPAKKERIDAIRKAVIQSAYTERPGFRWLSSYVLTAMHRGYEEDPSQYRLRFYEGLTWDALQKWYEQHIASTSSNNPTVTVVTGDARQVPLSTLQKYGEVTTLEMEDVFRN